MIAITSPADGGPATSPVSRRRHLAALLLIAVVAGLLYANTLPNELVYDDQLIIPNSSAIRNPWDIRTIVGGRYWEDIRKHPIYRPFTVWTLALNFRGNVLAGRPGESPASFHWLNVGLHAATACLILVLLTGLGLSAPAGLVTALIFAAHPLHTEAVACLVNRAEMLAAFWGLLFLILHRRRRLPVATAGIYLLAMLSKESAGAFFPVAIMMDLLFPRPSKRPPFATYGLYALMASAWIFLRSEALGAMPRTFPFVDNPLVRAATVPRILTAMRVQLDYLRLQLIPTGLSSDYSYNQIPTVSGAADPRVLVFIAIALTAIGCAWAARKSHPAIAWAVFGYAALFATTSNILFPIGTIMAERLTYAPSIFFCLLLGYGAARLQTVAGTRAVAAGLAVLIALYSAQTVARNRTWANDLDCFRAQTAAAPRSAKAHYNLGSALAKTGDDRAAIAEFRSAIAILPHYPEPYYNMANSLRILGGDPGPAIDAYRHAIGLDSGHRDARANLALLLFSLGRNREEARALTDELARLDPRHPSLATLRQLANTAQQAAGKDPIANRIGTDVKPVPR